MRGVEVVRGVEKEVGRAALSHPSGDDLCPFCEEGEIFLNLGVSDETDERVLARSCKAYRHVRFLALGFPLSWRTGMGSVETTGVEDDTIYAVLS
jgi:hypothetical protein